MDLEPTDLEGKSDLANAVRQLVESDDTLRKIFFGSTSSLNPFPNIVHRLPYPIYLDPLLLPQLGGGSIRNICCYDVSDKTMKTEAIKGHLLLVSGVRGKMLKGCAKDIWRREPAVLTAEAFSLVSADASLRDES